MRLVLLRHAACDANHARRFLGRATDAALSNEGRARCREVAIAGIAHVFSSPMRRAIETGQLVFPGAEVEAVAGLEEFDFGSFEGHTNEELKDDPAYRSWVDGWCIGPCPGGEDRAAFDARTCTALERTLAQGAAIGTSPTIVVCHGGTIMAGMARWAERPHEGDGYFSWHVPNLGGYALIATHEDGRLRFADVTRFSDIREVLTWTT